MKIESASSHWQILLEQSQRIIAETNKNDSVIAHWTFGGGTALMLQIHHRESYDIDLFLDDPQIIGYLHASAVKLNFSIGVPSYTGDGSTHFRIVFPNYGEIDFIVAAELTATPFKNTLISGNRIKLETVEEIIAKKIRFRGAMIQPRDVFDIAAACHAGYQDSIKATLSDYPDYRDRAASTLRGLSDDFINSTLSQMMTMPEFTHLKSKAKSRALEALSAA